jgi:hypothetical protein
VNAQYSTVRLALPVGRSLPRSISTRDIALSLAVPVPFADSDSAWPAQLAGAPPAPPPPPPVP